MVGSPELPNHLFFGDGATEPLAHSERARAGGDRCISMLGRLSSDRGYTKGVLTVCAIPECMAPGASKKARTSHSANGSAEMDRFDPDKSYQIIAHPVLIPSFLHMRTRSVRALEQQRTRTHASARESHFRRRH